MTEVRAETDREPAVHCPTGGRLPVEGRAHRSLGPRSSTVICARRLHATKAGRTPRTAEVTRYRKPVTGADLGEDLHGGPSIGLPVQTTAAARTHRCHAGSGTIGRPTSRTGDSVGYNAQCPECWRDSIPPCASAPTRSTTRFPAAARQASRPRRTHRHQPRSQDSGRPRHRAFAQVTRAQQAGAEAPEARVDGSWWPNSWPKIIEPSIGCRPLNTTAPALRDPAAPRRGCSGRSRPWG